MTRLSAVAAAHAAALVPVVVFAVSVESSVASTSARPCVEPPSRDDQLVLGELDGCVLTSRTGTEAWEYSPTGPIFPTVGCWRVTGKQGVVSPTFVVTVTTVRARAG